ALKLLSFLCRENSNPWLVPMKAPIQNKIYFFGAALLCLSGCTGKPHADPPAPPLVEVAAVTQADVPIYHDWIGVLEGFVNAHIRDLVGPNSGELTTVSTVDPIKAYYNVTEQAYINFTKLFTTESDRYQRLGKLDIELVLANGEIYPLKGRIYAADRQISPT